MDSRDADFENLETVMDARYLLVDGLGRPRAGLVDVEAVESRVRCKILAYYAVLLARHARLVRSARAAATVCVEACEDDHECVAVPSRIYIYTAR